MTRDHRKLRVFHDADALVLDVYRSTANLPPAERFGLQSQIRRAAIWAVANIVEGAARPGERDYQRFLYVALASARECGYLIDLATRLNYLDSSVAAELVSRFGKVQASLLQLCRAPSKPVGSGFPSPHLEDPNTTHGLWIICEPDDLAPGLCGLRLRLKP